jgi:hypothetical protein
MLQRSDSAPARRTGWLCLAGWITLAMAVAPGRSNAQAPEIQAPPPPPATSNRLPELAPPPRAEPPAAPSSVADQRGTSVPAQPLEPVAPVSPPPQELIVAPDVDPAVPALPAPARDVPPPTPPGPTVETDRPASTPRSSSVTIPQGATIRCKDGEYLTGTPEPTRCDGKGGVAILIPQPPPPPPDPLP